MKTKVDKETCVGCGLCVDTCPAVFDMPDDVAVVISDEVPKDEEDTCRQAAENCPVEAITIEE